MEDVLDLYEEEYDPLYPKNYRFPDNLPRGPAPPADRLSHIIWRGIGRSLFSFSLPFFVRSRHSFAKISERCAKKCLKKIAFLAHLMNFSPICFPASWF
jgi:hypothetical protein